MTNRIKILDCTLRDGGYVNDFNFGEGNLKFIVEKLAKASVDIIECGFLQSGAFDKNRSLFGSVEAVRSVIGRKNPQIMYVGMIQYGGIGIDEITEFDGTSIDGIRLTFHEHEIDEAFILGKQLMYKGYKIFMQPVGTTTYTDGALLKLIDRVNQLMPYAFYLVDTLGTMYKNDLLRMFYLVDHNLNKRIAIGFHSHNNLQLSFANAQELIQLNTPRNLIIDASIFGMGRGAGNLNTELVTQYINANFELHYNNIEILELIDEYIRPLSMQYKWGYDAAYYIASVTGCHPNYATFLLNKQTLHVQDIYAILSKLDSSKRSLFDLQYAGEEYLRYMGHHIDDRKVREQIAKLIGHKKVMLLAPGKSLRQNTEIINDLITRDKYFVISVNFVPAHIQVNMAFVSNMKRFKDFSELINKTDGKHKLVVTSNITTELNDKISIIDYSSYINEEQCISDNAGLMCINFLNKIEVESIALAGFDGFSADKNDNFYDASMTMNVETDRLMQINSATIRKIAQLRKQMKIDFITKSVYQM